MAKETSNSTVRGIRLIHLFWTIVVVLIVAAMAFGEINRQLKVNTGDIGNKVEKEVYNQHVDNQNRQFDQIIKSLDKIEKKM